MFNERLLTGMLIGALAWFGFRLLLTLLVIIMHVRKGGWNHPLLTAFVGPCTYLSGLAGAIAGALVWRLFVAPPGPFVTLAASALGFLLGFLVGTVLDLLLILRGEQLGQAYLATRLPVLAEQLQHPDASRRALAARKLRFVRSRAAPALPQLLAVLRDPDAEVRCLVTFAVLGCLSKDETIAPGMREALQDEDLRVRVGAACTLVRLGLIEVADLLPPLIAGLSHPDRYVSHNAAFYLGELGPKAEPAIPALAESLREGKGWQRNCNVIDALVRIGEPAVGALAEALRDENEVVRYEAAGALESMGGLARAAANPLREALRDGDKEVRRRAARALANIFRKGEG